MLTVMKSAWLIWKVGKRGEGNTRHPVSLSTLLSTDHPSSLRWAPRCGSSVPGAVAMAITCHAQSRVGRVVLVAPEPHAVIPSNWGLFALPFTKLHPSRPLCVPLPQHPSPCGPVPFVTPPDFICLLSQCLVCVTSLYPP